VEVDAMVLKAGHVGDFSGSLAEAIETAMKQEWQLVKGEALPDIGQEDRRLLFVAVARGVIQFLDDHQDEIFTSIRLTRQGTVHSFTYRVEALEFNAGL
jgi:hypothetical protein